MTKDDEKNNPKKNKISPDGNILNKQPKNSGERITDLWERLDQTRNKRLQANILSWKQIDRQDIKNLLTSLLNRKRLSLSAK